MTTGCTCGTPGCPGIAPDPGGRCPRCRTETMPPGARRLVRHIIVAVLGPPELAAHDLFGQYWPAYQMPRNGVARERYAHREAGS
jgi:hypothetical protein